MNLRRGVKVGQKLKMQLQKAKQIGEEVLDKLRPYLIKGELAGSIRRKKKEVHDIDLVIELKKEFMAMTNIKKNLKSYGRFVLDGKKLIRILTEDDAQIDVYIAYGNYDTLLLIRTGSTEHNKKMCIKAKSLNYSLTAKGLMDKDIGLMIATKEKDIFRELGFEYKEPEER